MDATLACIAFVFDSLGFDKSDHTISLRLGAAIFAAIPFLDGTVVALIDRFFRSQVAPVSVGDLPTPANEIARHLAFRNLRFSQQSEIPAAPLRVREDVVE